MDASWTYMAAMCLLVPVLVGCTFFCRIGLQHVLVLKPFFSRTRTHRGSTRGTRRFPFSHQRKSNPVVKLLSNLMTKLRCIIKEDEWRARLMRLLQKVQR